MRPGRRPSRCFSTAPPEFAAARSGPTDLDVVADIVRRLDGMPLAIELAAGRLSTFSPSDLHDRLDRALDLLGGGQPSIDARHRSLRATVEWSHQLLTDDEQRLFRHLAVFVDGVDLDTAELRRHRPRPHRRRRHRSGPARRRLHAPGHLHRRGQDPLPDAGDPPDVRTRPAGRDRGDRRRHLPAGRLGGRPDPLVRPDRGHRRAKRKRTRPCGGSWRTSARPGVPPAIAVWSRTPPPSSRSCSMR